MGVGLAVLNRLAGSTVIDRLGLRATTERLVYHGAKAGFRVAGASGRTFTRLSRGGPARRQTPTGDRGVFDLEPTEDQQMIVQVVREFAAEVLRPGAAAADDADDTPKEVLGQTGELGLTLLNVPEALGGLSDERAVVTGVLVAEALAEGDMGQAVACLAPASVATAISRWGSESQQQTYLPAFTGDDVPADALALAEPRVLFDPLAPSTTATPTDDGYVIDGVKSGVVRGTEAEVFEIGRAHV